jgi:hypothetical protein
MIHLINATFPKSPESVQFRLESVLFAPISVPEQGLNLVELFNKPVLSPKRAFADHPERSGTCTALPADTPRVALKCLTLISVYRWLASPSTRASRPPALRYNSAARRHWPRNVVCTDLVKDFGCLKNSPE